MKPTDLRVGNFISFLGVPTRVGELITKELKDCYVPVFGDDVSKYCVDKGINPEPITEKWLEAFGFKIKEPINKIYLKHFDEFGFTGLLVFEMKYDDPNGNAINYWGVGIYDNYTGKGGATNFPTKLHYVHQLQNLWFAMALEDLQLIVDESSID